MTTQFDQMNHLINDCDWYIFPNELQRILPIVMMSTQQPVVLQGFANMKCTRDAFKQVIDILFQIKLKLTLVVIRPGHSRRILLLYVTSTIRKLSADSA